MLLNKHAILIWWPTSSFLLLLFTFICPFHIFFWLSLSLYRFLSPSSLDISLIFISLTSFYLYLLNLFYPVLVFNMYYENVSIFENKNHSSCISIYILTLTMTQAHFFYFVYINFASIQNQNVQLMYLYLIVLSWLNLFWWMNE